MRKAWAYKRKNVKGWWVGWYQNGKRKAKAFPNKSLAEHFRHIKYTQLNADVFTGVVDFDWHQMVAAAFETLGIHNCAWNANPYLELYATVPNLGYIDMGIASDLKKARALMPHARRALMYTPMDLADKPINRIRADLERVAREYAPCDVVFADIESSTPDRRILDVIEYCAVLSAG